MQTLIHLVAFGFAGPYVAPTLNSLAGEPALAQSNLVGSPPIESMWQRRQDANPLQGSRLGQAVLAIADLNGDGIREVAVGAPVQTLLGRFGAGVVVILDGAHGEVVGHWMPGPRAGIGHTLAPAPDVDGDGMEDVLVGFEGLPVTEVRSADGGAILGVIPVTSTFVFATGDVDGDGSGDFLVPTGDPWRVYSSKLGESSEPLLRLPAPADGTFVSLNGLEKGGERDGFAGGLMVKETTVAVQSIEGPTLRYAVGGASWLADVEGQVAQAAVAGNTLALQVWHPPGKPQVSLVQITDSAVAPPIPVPSPFGNQGSRRLPFGYEMCSGDDLDGDLARDFVIASQGTPFIAGAAAISSADGSLLWQASWMDAGATSRVALEAFDDVDGDGVGDILAGTSDAFWHGRVRAHGSVRLLSGATGRELWVLKESASGLRDPFELATVDQHRLVILTGKASRLKDQIARIELDLAGATLRKVLVLVAKEDSVEVLFGELPFELPRSYLQDRFELSALDFEVTLVGLDGKPKAYLYQEAEPSYLWRLFEDGQ